MTRKFLGQHQIALTQSHFGVQATKDLPSGVQTSYGQADFTITEDQDWAVIESDGRINLASGIYLLSGWINWNTSGSTGTRNISYSNADVSITLNAAVMTNSTWWHSFVRHIAEDDSFGTPMGVSISQTSGDDTSGAWQMSIIKFS